MKQLFIILSLSFLFTSCREEKIIYIADYTVTCESNDSTQECLLWRENEDDKWSEIENNIQGFTYEKGYSYKIKIKIEKDTETNKLIYSLVDILEKKQSKKTSDSKTPLMGKWRVMSIQNFITISNVRPIFTITKNNINGNTGCNQFGGNLETRNNSFKPGILRMTKMYCQDTNEIERAFINALNNATYYTIKNNVITILNSNREMVFNAKKLE